MSTLKPWAVVLPSPTKTYGPGAIPLNPEWASFSFLDQQLEYTVRLPWHYQPGHWEMNEVAPERLRFLDALSNPPCKLKSRSQVNIFGQIYSRNIQGNGSKDTCNLRVDQLH
ncbi:hypothetical protein ABKN59_005503 [Abortiporus biennis]